MRARTRVGWQWVGRRVSQVSCQVCGLMELRNGCADSSPAKAWAEWSVSAKPGRFPSAAPVKQVLLEDESGDPGREAEQRDPIRAQ